MNDKILKVKQTIKGLWEAFIFFTVLAFICLAVVYFYKHKELRLEYEASVGNWVVKENFDKYFAPVSFDDEIDEEKKMIYRNHLNDTINEDEIDSAIREKLDRFGKVDQKQYQSLWKKMNRKKIRKSIINNRIVSDFQKVIDKFELKDDSIDVAHDMLIEKLKKHQIQKENKSIFIPLPYVLGSFFGAMILPLLILLVWFSYKSKLKDLLISGLNEKKKKVLEHLKYGNEFEGKLNSLNDLLESKIIDKNKFDESLEKIVDEFYVLIYQEEKKKKDEDLIKKLNAALELGTINQLEYEDKLKEINY